MPGAASPGAGPASSCPRGSVVKSACRGRGHAAFPGGAASRAVPGLRAELRLLCVPRCLGNWPWLARCGRGAGRRTGSYPGPSAPSSDLLLPVRRWALRARGPAVALLPAPGAPSSASHRSRGAAGVRSCLIYFVIGDLSQMGSQLPLPEPFSAWCPSCCLRFASISHLWSGRSCFFFYCNPRRYLRLPAEAGGRAEKRELCSHVGALLKY